MPANPFVLQCEEPDSPVMQCSTTTIYGAPKGRPGRALPNTTSDLGIHGITLHCVGDSFDGFLAKACLGGTKMPVGCHVSFHYIIDAETGQISSLVSESDVAWAWQSYRGNFPPITPLDYCPCPQPCPQLPCPGDPSPTPVVYMGWPLLSAQFPNISADFYTLNIGITSPSRPEQSRLDNEICCVGPYGLSKVAYKQLVHLIAWLQSKYPTIILDKQHIAFEDEIVATDEQCLECPCGANGSCLVCDVSQYCQRCNNAIDPTLHIVDPSDVRYVLIETQGGCRAKVLLSDLITFIGQQ